MKTTTLAAGFAAALAFGGAASAATLTIDDTPGGDTVTYATYSVQGVGGYNPSGDAGSLALDLTVFEASDWPADSGLMIDGPATLKVEFLGKEAGAESFAFSFGGGTISNNDAVGTSYTFAQGGPGLVNFSFTSPTLGAAAVNGTSISGSAAIGFAYGTDGAIYAFFDDSGASTDRDYDDMVVRISIVPVPAAGLLMLGGLGGLAALRRKKKAA